jgi:hypothetical protein
MKQDSIEYIVRTLNYEAVGHLDRDPLGIGQPSFESSSSSEDVRAASAAPSSRTPSSCAFFRNALRAFDIEAVAFFTSASASLTPFPASLACSRLYRVSSRSFIRVYPMFVSRKRHAVYFELSPFTTDMSLRSSSESFSEIVLPDAFSSF